MPRSADAPSIEQTASEESASSSPMDLERAQQSELVAESQDVEAALLGRIFTPLAVGQDDLEGGVGGLHSSTVGEEWAAPGGASMPAFMQHLLGEDSEDEVLVGSAQTHAYLEPQRHVPTRADGTLNVAAFLADVEDPIQALEEELAAERQRAREALPAEWRHILRDVEIEGGLIQALDGLAIEEESGVEEPELGEQEENGVEEPELGEQEENGVEEPELGEQEENGVEEPELGEQEVWRSSQAHDGAEPAAPLHEGDDREEATLRDQLELLEASLEGKPERPTVISRASESERGEESPEELFQRLRPVCSELLVQRGDAVRLAQSLRRLASLLAPSNPAAMAQCVEYVSFPVLAILDACVDKHCERQEPHAIPAAASEDVFETALACMLVLLRGSRTALPDRQVLLLLHRLSRATAAQAVGEEIRLAALHCLGALLQLPPDTRIPAYSFVGDEAASPSLARPISDVFASALSSPLFGFLVKQLLQRAQAEASGGERRVCELSLRVLHCLVAHMADADRLAFFLPGIVIGLRSTCGVLLASGSANAGHLIAAVDALFYTIARCVEGCDAEDADEAGVHWARQLERLQRVAENAAVVDATGAWPEEVQTVSGADSSAPHSHTTSQVDRSPAWLRSTRDKLLPLLSKVLEGVAQHPSPRLQVALCMACGRLLRQSSRSLGPDLSRALMTSLGTSSQHAYPLVAGAAVEQLRAWAGHSAHAREMLAVEAVQALLSLPTAVQSVGSLARGRVACAAGYLSACEKSVIAERVVRDPVCLEHACRALSASVAVDPAAVTLFLASHRVPDVVPSLAAGTLDEAARSDSSTAPRPANPVTLPCMPLGLAGAVEKETFGSIAECCTRLGRAAAASQGLELLLLAVAAPLRRAADAAAAHRAARLRRRSVEPEGDAAWKADVASALCVASFVGLGVSDSLGGAAASPLQAVLTSSVLDTLRALEAVGAWEGVGGEVILKSSVETPAALESPATLESPALEIQSRAAIAPSSPLSALLTRASLEYVGSSARSLGPAFAQSPLLIRHSLLHVLEAAGSQTLYVQGPAACALHALCLCGGYGAAGLGALVSEHADAVVDGLCRRLACLERHPHTPQLVATLMRRAGVPARLLPLLAEPMQAAVRGLSISERTKRPQHVLAFVQALAAASAGCLELAAGARAEVEGVRDAVVEAFDAHNLGQREPSSLLDAPLPPSALWAADLRDARRKVHAAATLAAASSDAGSVLVCSRSLAVAVAALRLCLGALQVLHETTAAVEAVEREIEPRVDRLEGGGPLPPQSPRLLPSVHLFWTPLLAALKDWRVAVVMEALAALGSLVELGGSFLTRRVTREAWPQLAALLRSGAPVRTPALPAPGHDRLESPAALRKIQCAALSCLLAVARPARARRDLCGGGGAADVARSLADVALGEVGGLLGAEDAAVREAATTTFMALAEFNAPLGCRVLLAAAAGEDEAVLAAETNRPAVSGEEPAAVRVAIPRSMQRCSRDKLQNMALRLAN